MSEFRGVTDTELMPKNLLPPPHPEKSAIPLFHTLHPRRFVRLMLCPRIPGAVVLAMLPNVGGRKSAKLLYSQIPLVV